MKVSMEILPSPTRIRRQWPRNNIIISLYYRAMIFLLAFLISLLANVAVIDARCVQSPCIEKNWEYIQQNYKLAFIHLPQATTQSYTKAADDESIFSSDVLRSPHHPTKSAHILGFWSKKEVNDYDAAASDSSQSQSSPIIREYKQMDDEEDGLYLPGQPDMGVALYNATQSAVGIKETTIPVDTNTTRRSKRSRLVSSLRSLRPLVVPPWMLPLMSSGGYADSDIDQLDTCIASTTTSSLPALPQSELAEVDQSQNEFKVSDELALQINRVIDAEIESRSKKLALNKTKSAMSNKEGQENDRTRRRFFRSRRDKDTKSNHDKNIISKEEAACPVIVSNIDQLRDAVLTNKVPLRDVGFRFPVNGVGSEVLPQPSSGTSSDTRISLYIDDPSAKEEEEISAEIESAFQRHDPVINGTLSSLLTCSSEALGRNSTYYQHGIELLSNHPVLSLVQERVRTNSTPGNRLASDTAHLALVIEGGGMRGAVSAGMAAALSTLDLLDSFDSVHGSSAGAIIGAYVVSRQLCTDVYTDIMPAAGSKFASKRRTLVNVGVDWLADLVSSYDEPSKEEVEKDISSDSDAVCELVDDVPNSEIDAGDVSMWICDDELALSSVELAMGKIPTTPKKRSRWTDDHYDGLLFESMQYLISRARSAAKRTISKPISFGMKHAGQAFDLAASMGQYLRRKPGMNLTYVLDGIMDETHGLRPFDIDAFRANDKIQPLYIVASAVSKGGSGEMETLAFNSKDGDFFGLSQDSNKASKTGKDKRPSWYRRVWNAFKRASSALYSIAYNILLPEDPEYTETILPPGTNAIGGLVNRRKHISTPEQREENFYEPTGRVNDEGKSGLFPCLEASMLVPGIGNAPINLLRSNRRKFIEYRKFPRFLPRRQTVLVEKQKKENSHLCYDAFCYEPIPYRSAVEKAGATHVLALRSRPDGCVVETRQHLYERVIGPIYFRKHGMNNVAKLFSTGGSQYRYIEDVLTLNDGLTQGIALGSNLTQHAHPQGVKVPPTTLLYGTDKPEEVSIADWKRAHLLPISIPIGSPELPTLSQDRDEVLKAVRHGYAAAFDILAPIAGLSFDSKNVPGEKVAEILFPGGDDDISDVLNKPVKIKPSYIGANNEVIKELKKRERFAAWVTGKREAKRKAQEEIASHPQGALAKMIERRSSSYHESDQYVRDSSNTLEWLETEALLAALPGFRNGKLDHIAETLLTKDERKQDSNGD